MKLQRDWLLNPQSLPFAQRIKTHALVSLVQKGLQYYKVEQEVNQVSRAARYFHSQSLRFRSLAFGTHHQRQRFSLALIPPEHHLSPIGTKTTMVGLARHDNANTVANLVLMDWALNCLHRYPQPRKAVGAMVPMRRAPAIAQLMMVCKSTIQMATIIRPTNQRPLLLLTSHLLKMGE